MAETVDSTLLRELFLQRLPTNVRMVIIPSAGALNLDQLAQLADRIVEASLTLTIAGTNTTAQFTDQVLELTRRLEHLSTQMSKAVSSFRQPDHGALDHDDVDHTRLSQMTTSAGITEDSEMIPRNVSHPARSQKTLRPVASCDERSCPTNKSPLFLTDATSGRRFLIETGAEVSVSPPSSTDRKNKQDCSGLRAVNDYPIATFGTGSLTLDLGLRRVFR